MHPLPLLIYLALGLVEFVVINKALRQWLDTKSWMVWLGAAAASYVPVVGGCIAFVAAIAMLEWPWWIAGAIFIGGTIALALTGGIGSVLGQASLF